MTWRHRLRDQSYGPATCGFL